MGSVPSILIIDENLEDVTLLRRSFNKTGVLNPIYWVKSRCEAMAYVEGEAPYHDRTRYPEPSVILLDLQMSNDTGFEVLEWLRNKFPSGGLLIVVLTRIEDLRKVNRAYAMGANSFLTKPSKPDELLEVIRIFNGYWLLNNRFPERFTFGNRFSEEPYVTK